jgi:formamidopyrimidine-DNA glycosylase
MPELPEVETIARGVHERLRGDRIVEAWFGSHREPFKTPPGRQAKGLEGRAILAVHRTGKHIVCELSTACGNPMVESAGGIYGLQRPMDRPSRHDRQAAGYHFRCSPCGPHSCPVEPGQRPGIALCGPAPVWAAGVPRPEPRPRLQRGGSRPIDRDRGGVCRALPPPKAAHQGGSAQPEAALRVGNIYADESLFRAGIRPRRLSGRLTRAELEALRLALREVLEHAIRLGGSSVSDYVDADGVRGFFQLEHCVYLRTGLPCRRCQTPIRRILLAGRGTHYCPQCQR